MLEESWDLTVSQHLQELSKKCINTGDVTASKGIQVGGLFGYVSITSSTEEYRNIENFIVPDR